MDAVKIVVVGDVMGNFKEVFSRVSKINKDKGPFESLFCIGNFFGDNDEEYEDLKQGRICVPLSTYIMNGNQSSFKELYEPLHELIPRITYVGKKGYISTASGLKIAYLCGIEMSEDVSDNTKNDASDCYSVYFTRELVTSLIKSVGSETDILLTSQWPKYVTKYDEPLNEEKESKVKNCSSLLISYLVEALKPRYHFSGMTGFFYERCPYRNHVIQGPAHVTRFLGLASVKNTTKEKWIYAFNVTPRRLMTAAELKLSSSLPTLCPYPLNKELIKQSENNFFYDLSAPGCSKSTSKRSVDSTSGKKHKKRPLDTSKCWFCFSNSNVEKDLIIAIGKHCYIALAKGVLVPEHVIIVPINHISSCIALSPEAFEEVEKFKQALIGYFYFQRKRDVVFFERNYHSPHLQIQAIPIPRNLQNEIEDKITSFDEGLPITQIPSTATIREVVSGDIKDYFYLEVIKNMEVFRKYMIVIAKNQKHFPLQLGRDVVAQVLHLEHRISWEACADPVVEKEMAEQLRHKFKGYDPVQE